MTELQEQIINELAESVARAMLTAERRLRTEAALSWTEAGDAIYDTVTRVIEDGAHATLAEFDR